MFNYSPDIFIPQKISPSWSDNVSVDVLRTDLLHPVVSGNKWFKLKYYVEDALSKGFEKMVTFGGAFSNHIVASAFAAKQAGLRITGIIRGEPDMVDNSPTLQQAQEYGMHFHFVARNEYRDKELIKNKFNDFYIVNEGGYGKLGAKGAEEMLTGISHFEIYDYIIHAVGSGTTMAGIINAAHHHQKVIGVSVMKNNYSLESEMKNLINKASYIKKYELLHSYHFGGYAKKTDELINYMNSFYKETAIPTDFVYTGKTAFALKDLINNKVFKPYAKVLFIHTGGLQGNRSLPDGKLIFK